MFCYYCGCIGHHERLCSSRKVDLQQHCQKGNEYGTWLRANSGRFIVGRGQGRKAEVEGGGSEPRANKDVIAIDMNVVNHSNRDSEKGEIEGANEGTSFGEEVQSSRGQVRIKSRTDDLKAVNLILAAHTMKNAANQEPVEVQYKDDLMLIVNSGCMLNETKKNQRDEHGGGVMCNLKESLTGISPLVDCTNLMSLESNNMVGEKKQQSKGQ